MLSWRPSRRQTMTKPWCAISRRVATIAYCAGLFPAQSSARRSRESRGIEVGAVALGRQHRRRHGCVRRSAASPQSDPAGNHPSYRHSRPNGGQAGDRYGRLRSLIGPADLVIAQNASFDRPFCEAFSSLFSDKAWACSVSGSLGGTGFEGTKLGLPDRPDQAAFTTATARRRLLRPSRGVGVSRGGSLPQCIC